MHANASVADLWTGVSSHSGVKLTKWFSHLFCHIVTDFKLIVVLANFLLISVINSEKLIAWQCRQFSLMFGLLKIQMWCTQQVDEVRCRYATFAATVEYIYLI